MQIHQFSATVAYGDAASNHILSVQRMLRELGYQSRIFCDLMPSHFEGQVEPISRYARYSSPDNLLICHFALSYSPVVMSWLRQIPDRKVMIYHNITPDRFFEGIDLVMVKAAQTGRRQLGELSAIMDAGWGVSAYNCAELESLGWRNVDVLPIIFDPARYQIRPACRVLARWKDKFNVLFVGRISPNKCFEDLILTFYELKRSVRPDANLLLVGATSRMQLYMAFLRALVERLDLPDVFFAGHVTNSELIAYYQCADVYLSMSEHEGFCVPLLESAYFGLPVVAYKAAAIPETLGNSGILFTRKDYAAVAELIGLLAERVQWKEQIVAQQRERLQDFTYERIKEQLQHLLSQFLS